MGQQFDLDYKINDDLFRFDDDRQRFEHRFIVGRFKKSDFQLRGLDGDLDGSIRLFDSSFDFCRFFRAIFQTRFNLSVPSFEVKSNSRFIAFQSSFGEIIGRHSLDRHVD